MVLMVSLTQISSKAANVLIDDSGRACIRYTNLHWVHFSHINHVSILHLCSDFGLVKIKLDSAARSTRLNSHVGAIEGTLRWMVRVK